METTVEILNKIANKLGDENADQYTTVAQALGSIANALGNADPDKIQTVPEALEEILAVAGGGGGASSFTNTFFDGTVTTSGRPGSYTGFFDPSVTPLMGTVDITLDGVLYQNVKNDNGYWGDTNYEEFPFYIDLANQHLYTTTEGDHTLKIEQTITPTPITFTVVNQSTVGNISFSLNMTDADSNMLNLFANPETTVTGTALSYTEEYVPVFQADGFTSEPNITVVNGTFDEDGFTLRDGAIITIK